MLSVAPSNLKGDPSALPDPTKSCCYQHLLACRGNAAVPIPLENSEGKSLPSETSTLGPAQTGMEGTAFGMGTVTGAGLGGSPGSCCQVCTGSTLREVEWPQGYPAETSPALTYILALGVEGRGLPQVWLHNRMTWEMAWELRISLLRENQLPMARPPRAPTPRTTTPGSLLWWHPHLGRLGFLHHVKCVGGIPSLDFDLRTWGLGGAKEHPPKSG